MPLDSTRSCQWDIHLENQLIHLDHQKESNLYQFGNKIVDMNIIIIIIIIIK
jgi:hypothetical protein